MAVKSEFEFKKENRMKNRNMNMQPISRSFLRIAQVITLGMAFAVALPLTAHAQIVTPPVPTDLQVPATEEAFLLGHGVGTQNYICQPAASLGRVAWTLSTPQAALFSDDAEQLTTHFFSINPEEPNVVRVTWQDSRDTSTIWARLLKAVPVNPDAIAWLKLEVVGKRVGPTGGDTLFGTTFVQRLNTQGGLAPLTDCDNPQDIGRKAFIPYTADYFFYRRK
jgi:hypothetical protein